MKTGKAAAILVFLMFIAFGFFQERLKISLNFHLEQGNRIEGFYSMSHEQRAEQLSLIQKSVNAPYDYYWSHDPIYYYNYLNYRSLTLLKWALAAVFVSVAFLFSRFILKLWFADRKREKWLIYIFALIFGAITILASASCLIGAFDKTYPVIRELLGIIQSPLPLLLVGVMGSFLTVSESTSN